MFEVKATQSEGGRFELGKRGRYREEGGALRFSYRL